MTSYCVIMSNQPRSPYKKMKARNSSYFEYTSMSALTPHKPYKITDIIPTVQEKFGNGQLAFVQDCRNRRYKVKLPQKYLNMLEIPADIDVFKMDIRKGDNPFLIFREQLKDNSFRIDICPSGEDVKGSYEAWTEMPELDMSGSSIDSPPSKQQKTDNASSPSETPKVDSNNDD